MTRFEGRTAVVTGAAGQIGGATARRLAEEGAKVLVVDRDAEGVSATVAAIEEAKGVARGCVADVIEAEAIARYAAEGAELGGGRIDAFFNNAGVEGPVAPIEEYPVEDFDRVLAINVRAVFLGLKHVLPHMGEGSAIVNTASVAGVLGAPAIVAYVAAKHAVVGITRTAAVETGGRGIRVNAVCPGVVPTQMIADVAAAWHTSAEEMVAGEQLIKRPQQAREIGAAVVFLAVMTSMTGQSVNVDGGAILH